MRPFRTLFQSMTSKVCLYRNQSVFFQRCKSPKVPLGTTVLNVLHFSHAQWKPCVRSQFGLSFLFRWLTADSRFLPVMVGRIMLSLRKAADMPEEWTLEELSTNDRNRSIKFRRPWRSSRARKDSIMLATISTSRTAT